MPRGDAKRRDYLVGLFSALGLKLPTVPGHTLVFDKNRHLFDRYHGTEILMIDRRRGC